MTFFIRKTGKHLLITHIYVHGIVSRATYDSFSHEFAKKIKSEFQMSMIGELNLFLAYKLS
jgi:hypothetical protein